MKIFLIVVVCLVLLVGLFYIFSVVTGPKKKDFVEFIEPRIIDKPDMLAIVVDFDGDADKVIKEAFGRMFKKYFSLKGVPKGGKQPAPIARYSNFDNVSELSQEELKKMDWTGFTAIKVPSGTASFQDEYVRLETVEYGKVAEIVHFGSYESEVENITKLKEFIKKSGYEISGLHEEEYIVGPGLIYRSPKSYITIIRYQIK
ncbi:MAG: GyrI-like domain-containing protein [Spirochaetaceae bacterium]